MRTVPGNEAISDKREANKDFTRRYPLSWNLKKREKYARQRWEKRKLQLQKRTREEGKSKEKIMSVPF